ncbi:hypothetical protein GQ42DRAFT_44233 [Ramicandelaber brevisporus]|nr:hypothetical protein GQ42DRAFT_44233 [Ramicandelaber brevisporus]
MGSLCLSLFTGGGSPFISSAVLASWSSQLVFSAGLIPFYFSSCSCGLLCLLRLLRLLSASSVDRSVFV